MNFWSVWLLGSAEAKRNSLKNWQQFLFRYLKNTNYQQVSSFCWIKCVQLTKALACKNKNLLSSTSKILWVSIISMIQCWWQPLQKRSKMPKDQLPTKVLQIKLKEAKVKANIWARKRKEEEKNNTNWVAERKVLRSLMQEKDLLKFNKYPQKHSLKENKAQLLLLFYLKVT